MQTLLHQRTTLSNKDFCRELAACIVLGLTAAAPAALALPPVPQQAAALAPGRAQEPRAAPVQDFSYDVGLLIGNQLANNGLGATLSRQALVRGISEALDGKLPSVRQRDDAQQFSHAGRKALTERNAQLAHQFLDKNAHERGISTLASGLQYRVLAAGNVTAPLPGPQDQITLRYRASLPDGTEIDRSDDHGQPATFRLDAVIQGWREALSAMRPGDKWQIFVPPELSYGANSPPPIPPGSLLVYELELLRVETIKPLAPR